MGSISDEGRILSVRQRVRESRRLVVLTGAGVSAESGVPTFRGKEGRAPIAVSRANLQWEERNFRAEELATPEAFARQPRLVWEWYAWRMALISPLRPNPAHKAIVEMEMGCPDFLLITQNIDGLHQKAGSRKLVELHGNLWRTKCVDCGAKKESREVPVALPPRCGSCGGLLRPDVVWFGEEIPRGALTRSLEAVHACDVMIVAGTSGVVQPAASFGIMASQGGAYVIEVNLERTPLSDVADEFFLGKAGEILPHVVPAEDT